MHCSPANVVYGQVIHCGPDQLPLTGTNFALLVLTILIAVLFITIGIALRRVGPAE